MLCVLVTSVVRAGKKGDKGLSTAGVVTHVLDLAADTAVLVIGVIVPGLFFL